MFGRVINRRSGLILALAMLFALLLAMQPHTAQAADARWRARYWNNRNFEGTPVLDREESNINYDWGGGSPAPEVNDDNFTARWTRNVNFPASGVYRFSGTTDDGMRVWVDDTLVINSWFDSQAHPVSGDVYVNAGDHRVKVEYYEAGGQAVAKLNWQQVSGTPPTTPTDGPRWRGEYYNNVSLSGTPALVREDDRVDFDWGLGSPAPGIANDRFSVRWTRNVPLQQGRYRFSVTADDGVRLWVNNQLVIDEWHEAQSRTYTADVDVPGGNVPVRVEYYENQGAARISLSRSLLSATGANRWRGEYYNNRFLSGTPTLVRSDANVNFDWGTGRPDPAISADNFSARWTQSLNLAPGRYRFTATSDDGVRVYVNGQLVVDGWSDHPPRTFSGEVTVPGGATPVVVEYYEHLGGAMIQLSWSQLSGTAQPTPPSNQPLATVVRARWLSVRATPEMGDNLVTAVQGGTTVTMLGRNGGWIKVRLPGGATGWVGGSYLSTSYPITNLPVLSS